MAPLGFGQAVGLAYSYRPRPWLRVGGRALLGFSDHVHRETDRSFRLLRFALQGEGLFAHSFGRRFELGLGAYLGWQLALVTRALFEGAPGAGSQLNGDPAGMRAGLMGSLRLAVTSRLGVAVEGSWGVELLHANDGWGESRAQYFLRPAALLQVSYAF